MTALQTAGFAHPPSNVDALGLKPHMLVADFGAGSGHYTLEMAQQLVKGRVYAIDIQQDLLRRVHREAHQRGLKNVEIIWSDLEKAGGSKIADRHVDLVLVSNLLFQLEDKRAPLHEARRILRPAGMLAIIDWRDSYGGLGPIKKHVVKPAAAAELAAACGFALVEEFDAGAHHYGMILRPIHQPR